MAVYNNKLEMLLRVEQQQKQVDDNKQSDENLLILEWLYKKLKVQRNWGGDGSSDKQKTRQDREFASPKMYAF